MAVPKLRSSSDPLDPDLAREVREIGERIAGLQRRVEDFGKRSGATSGEEARGRFRNLLDTLLNEPVEDGIHHPAEPLLRAYWEEYPGHLPWSDAVGDDAHPSLFADFLRIASRVRPAPESLRARLLQEGLASPSLEVRDAAVQAAESWADAVAVEALGGHREEVAWLAAYIERIKSEIGSGLRVGA